MVYFFGFICILDWKTGKPQLCLQFLEDAFSILCLILPTWGSGQIQVGILVPTLSAVLKQCEARGIRCLAPPWRVPSIIVGHPAKAKHLLEDLCHCDVGQHDQAPWVVYLVADMFMPANMLTQHVLEDGLVCFLWPAAFVEACEGLPYPDGCKNLSSCLRVIGKEFPNLFFYILICRCLDVCFCQAYFKLWKSIFLSIFPGPTMSWVKPVWHSPPTKNTKAPALLVEHLSIRDDDLLGWPRSKKVLGVYPCSWCDDRKMASAVTLFCSRERYKDGGFFAPCREYAVFSNSKHTHTHNYIL